MGLLHKILHYVTGGSAEVDVDIENANLDKPFPVKITAEIKDNDLNIDSVYLLFRCQDARLDGYSESGPETDNERILRELNEWVFDTVYETRIDISGEGTLKGGEDYSWDTMVDLSECDEKSYDSPGRRVIWEVQAGIDIPGNDPDSGWVEFQVK